MHDASLSFQPLPGFYEPSAVVQLPDGRFLVVEDQGSHPLRLVSFGADGAFESTALRAGLLQMFSDFWKLDDLEGLTVDHAGFVYGITSHSRDAEGREKESRNKLIRFRVQGDSVVDPRFVTGLKQALTARHAVLAAAAQVRDVKGGAGLSIEGLALSPDQQRLLVGLRSPLREGRALIASVENPAGIFDSGEAPRVGASLHALDLGGQGIRDLAHVPALGAFLVIGGPPSRKPGDFSLWLWSGEPDAQPDRVSVPGLQGLRKAEGVSPAIVNNAERILLVSDDGSRSAKRPASYLLLDPARLQAAD